MSLYYFNFFKSNTFFCFSRIFYVPSTKSNYKDDLNEILNKKKPKLLSLKTLKKILIISFFFYIL